MKPDVARLYPHPEILHRQSTISSLNVKDLDMIMYLCSHSKPSSTPNKPSVMDAHSKAIARAKQDETSRKILQTQTIEAKKYLLKSRSPPVQVRAEEEKNEKVSEVAKPSGAAKNTDGECQRIDETAAQIVSDKPRIGPLGKRTLPSESGFLSDEQMPKNGEIKYEMARLSAELSRFPDDLDPISFFQCKAELISPFISDLKHLSRISSSMSLYHFNQCFSIFYNTYEIKVTSKTTEHVVYVPFSIGYFMMSLPRLVQLCLANQIASLLLKSNERLPEHLSFDSFFGVVSLLMGDENRNSKSDRRSILRKSIFSNNEMNKRFQEEEQKNLSANSQPQRHNPMFDISLVTNRSTFVKQEAPSLVKDVSSDSSRSSASRSSESKSSLSSHSSSLEISKSSDSLSEEEYPTKNPFELKYLQVFWKFQSYQISIRQPYVRYPDGGEEDLPPDFLFRVITKFQEFDLFTVSTKGSFCSQKDPLGSPHN